MYDLRSNQVDHRIVSLSQPHIRPIVRGKVGASTEFGAKLSASLVEGVAFIERISWDNYNESTDFIDQIEAFRERFEKYPESVHADQIYRTRANRSFCKDKGIRLSGPALGRPPLWTEANREELQAAKKLSRADEVQRNAIEGKFGQAKRRYGLNRIMTKLPETSLASIAMTFIAMNLDKWLKAIFVLFFLGILGAHRAISTNRSLRSGGYRIITWKMGAKRKRWNQAHLLIGWA